MEKWLAEWHHLPRTLRDFRDQKDLFKTIWRHVENTREYLKAKGEHDPYQDLNWITAQIFTIDQFLHFMAKHGWTLQRRRAVPGFDFHDLHASLAEYRKADAEAGFPPFKRSP
jgi:hypothetical protein